MLYHGKEEKYSELFINRSGIQSNKYYKTRAVGVVSEVGLSTDWDLSVPTRLRNTMSFIPLRYRKSSGTSTFFFLHFHIYETMLFFLSYKCWDIFYTDSSKDWTHHPLLANVAESYSPTCWFKESFLIKSASGFFIRKQFACFQTFVLGKGFEGGCLH